MFLKIIKKMFNNMKKINIINKKTEKFLAVLSLVFIFVLVVSQVGLFHESTRTFFTDIDKYEGVDVNDLDEVFKQGELTLKLIDISPNKNIKVLLNGTPEYEFTDETIKIDVRNNCLVEIDGVDIDSSFKVRIIDKSDNIAVNCIDTQIQVNSNIEVLERIFLK